MRVELSVVAVGPDGIERSYDYSVTIPDKTPLDQVEAHAKSMLRILDEQANEGEDDDAEDSGRWSAGA